MATQRNEIVTVLSIDARDLEAKTASVTANIDKLEGKIVELTNGVQGYSTQVDNAVKVTARQASSLESLLTSVDPVYAAHKKLADEQARVESGMKTLSNQFAAGQRSAEGVSSATAVLSAKSKELTDIQNQLRAGHISAEEALDKVKETMKTAADASKALGGAFKLSYENQQVLRSGVINTFQSISAGLPIGQTLLTQTTQTAPAFAEMAKNAGLSTTALLAMGIPAAAIAVGVSVIAIKLAQAADEMRSFTVALKAGSQQAQVTASDLEGMVKSLSHNGVTRSDAVSILSTVSSVQQSLSKSQISQIADLAPDMAVKFGDAAEAFKKAVGYLTGGVPGIRQAYEETGALSLAQYEAARAAYEHGNRAQALQIVLDGLKTKFAGLHQESLGPAQKAMEGLKTAYDELATTAANHPITIKVTMEMSEGFQWLTRFMKDPLNTEFPTFGLKGAFGGELAPLNSNPRTPSEGALTGNYRPPSSYPSAPAGTPVPGVKPTTVDGMTPKELGELSDLRHANDLLAEAMKKVGAERQVAVAGAQAYTAAINAGKSSQAAQKAQLEAERMARVQLSAAIADQTAQITIQARESLNMADAYMQSAAAGERAAAMRQAQLDSLQSGIDVETRYQQILNERAATQAATSAQALQTYQQEVAGREAVANATMEGVDAAYKAEMAEKVRIGTLAETIALENASGEAAEKLRKIIEAKTAAILDDERAQRKQQVAQAIQQQKDQIALGQAQLRLMGASAEERAVEIAKLQALVYLRNQHIDALSAEGQAYIANAENIARTQLETDRLQAAYQELERFGDQAFSSVIDAVVKGGDSTKTWANAVKGLATEFQTLALKMAVLNPVKNLLFGSNLPTLFDLTSAVSGPSSASGQAGGSGALGNAAVSLGSKFIPNSWFSGITNSIDTFGATYLGIGTASQMPATVLTGAHGMVTGGGATSIVPGQVASGTGLSSLLGAAGIGVGAGMLLPSLLGVQNKIGGGLLGAAGGAAGAMALAGSIVPGIGTAIGAITGLIAGLLGTQKPSVGKTASADVTILSGGKSATYGNILTDNEGDPATGKALGNALSTIYTLAAAGGGSLTKDFGIGQTEKKGLYVAGSVPYKEFGDDVAGLMRYTLLEQGGLKDGGVNTLKAIQNSKAKDFEESAKDIGLGASIDAGNTALKEMVKTLSGVTDAAKKATLESFKPMFEELDRATKLGIDGAYKALATDQLKAYLEQLRNPPDFTQVQTDMATLTGQFQAAREAYAKLDPAMVTYVDLIEKETKARLASNLNKSLDQQIAEAGGRGYVNQINGFLDTLNANARSLAAVGQPVTKAQELYNTSLTALLKTLTTDQLADITKTFGGDIGKLATAMATANDNAQQATQFETLIGRIRQENAQAELTALNEQKSAANALLTASNNLVKSASQARQSMLTGDMSILSPKEKLDEAVRQFDELTAKYNATGDADVGSQAVAMRDTVLNLARGFYASSEGYVSIFNHVSDGLTGVESAASRQASLASQQVSRLDKQIAIQQDTLKALQAVPTDIAAIIKGINPSNTDEILKWAKAQDTGTKTQIQRSVLQSYSNAQIESAFGGFSDIQAARAANPMFNLAEWFKTFGIDEILSGKRSIPGFANGGIIGNGIYGVDSVIASYAGGGNIALAGGEYVMPANQTAMYRPALDAMRAGTWGAANDRWGGGNVVEYRRPASGNSAGPSADDKRKIELLEEQNRLLTAILRTTAAAGDGTHAGLAEVATNVKAVAKKASGGGLRE